MKSKTPSGTWYEKFVRDIYQALVTQNAVANVAVQHNVILKGRSGATHQIDVFWEFDIAGARYRTCIECKAFKSTVKKTHIAAFAAILDDIGNANGIFVTMVGFQSGAKKFATDRHIRLIVLNPTLRAVHIDIQISMPEYSNFSFNIDSDAVKPLLAASGIEAYEFELQGTGDTIEFLDSNGCRACSLNEFVNSHPSTAGPQDVSLDGYFLQSAIGLLPLKSMTYEVTIHRTALPMSIEAQDAARAVLTDVLENTTTYAFDPKPEPKSDSAPLNKPI